MAAGDIACGYGIGTGDDHCRPDLTAALLRGPEVEAVLALGDIQYDDGTWEEFLAGYDRTWGRFRGKTFPVPGNHDYANDATSVPAGYFRYFGDRVRGPFDIAAYSVDLPVGCTPGEGTCWHVIAMSSMLCFGPGGCVRPTPGTAPTPGQRTWRWLRRDLRQHPPSLYPCTIAMLHHPPFSFSQGSGATSTSRQLLELLYASGVDLLLSGHSHNYQRWARVAPDGSLDADAGIRPFVVGTGGVNRYALQDGPWPAALRAAQDDAFGVLRLELGDGSYAWSWVGAARQQAFEDAGSSSCTGA